MISDLRVSYISDSLPSFFKGLSFSFFGRKIYDAKILSNMFSRCNINFQ